MQRTPNTRRWLMTSVLAAVLASAAGAAVQAVSIFTFAVFIEGNPVPNAAAYEIGSDSSRRHVLTLTLAVIDDTDPSPYQPGQALASAEVKLLSGSLQVVKTYTLQNPVVESVRRRGAAATNTLTEEVTFVGKTLGMTP